MLLLVVDDPTWRGRLAPGLRQVWLDNLAEANRDIAQVFLKLNRTF